MKFCVTLQEDSSYYGVKNLQVGTQKCIQLKGNIRVMEVIRKFPRYQRIFSSYGDIRVIEVRVIETPLYQVNDIIDFQIMILLVFNFSNI